MMTETIQMITCKQCGRDLPEAHFKKYKSRSTGQRSSTVSRYTICKTCEKMEAYANKIQKRVDTGVATDEDLKDRESIMYHYQRQIDAGRDIVTAAARRLMGLPELVKRRGAPSKLRDLLASYEQPVDINQYDDAGRCASDTPVSNDVEQIEWPVNETTEECDAETSQTFAERLERLLTMPLTEEPYYYDCECDALMSEIKMSNDGQMPIELIALASEVLERLDEYADNYEG